MTHLETTLCGAVVFLFAALAKVILGYRADQREAKIDADARVELAHAAKEKLREELTRQLDACERRSDALELSYREHLEHDARVFRGEADKRKAPRFETGVLDLDERRTKAENASRNLPPELLAQVRGMIERGEIQS